MNNLCKTLSRRNIDVTISGYKMLVEELGDSIANFKGIRLLTALKRGEVGVGPYPKVTLFEAANRIMSDLVILNGVKWLLAHDVFPFDHLTVEYGNEDKNGFDIRASAKGKSLIGEAFNVAPSFFPIKKRAMLEKLRASSEAADFKIIMLNDDALQPKYEPKLQAKEFFVVVNIGTGLAKVVSNPGIKKDAR